MTRGIALPAVCLVAALVAGGGAKAANECAGSDAERARCEQERRVERECAGRTGEALVACRATVLAPSTERQDCRRLPEGYARYKCEDENRRADLDARCGAPGGAELDRCRREVTNKAAAR